MSSFIFGRGILSIAQCAAVWGILPFLFFVLVLVLVLLRRIERKIEDDDEHENELENLTDEWTRRSASLR
jgi:preprotein translocase subunit SecG